MRFASKWSILKFWYSGVRKNKWNFRQVTHFPWSCHILWLGWVHRRLCDHNPLYKNKIEYIIWKTSKRFITHQEAEEFCKFQNKNKWGSVNKDSRYNYQLLSHFLKMHFRNNFKQQWLNKRDHNKQFNHIFLGLNFITSKLLCMIYNSENKNWRKKPYYTLFI